MDRRRKHGKASRGGRENGWRKNLGNGLWAKAPLKPNSWVRSCLCYLVVALHLEEFLLE